MCKHNDIDDYDCDGCAWMWGYESAMDNEPYENEYKDWGQANNYTDGYNAGLLEKVNKDKELRSND